MVSHGRHGTRAGMETPTPFAARVAAARCQFYLCRIYDLALLQKQYPKRKHISPREATICQALHKEFAPLAMPLKWCSESTTCDVCNLARAVKRLACSRYSVECSKFIVSTQSDSPEAMVARINFDLAEAFARYNLMAGWADGSFGREFMERAEWIAAQIRSTVGEVVTIDELRPASVEKVTEKGAEETLVENAKYQIPRIVTEHLDDSVADAVLDCIEQELEALRRERLRIIR